MKYSRRWWLHIGRSKMFEPLFRTGKTFLNHFFAKYPCLIYEKWTFVIIFCQGVHRRRLGGRFCSPWCGCSSFPGWTRKWGAAYQGRGLTSLLGGWASRCWFIILWWYFHHPGLEFELWVHQYKYKYWINQGASNMLVFCADDVTRWTLYLCSDMFFPSRFALWPWLSLHGPAWDWWFYIRDVYQLNFSPVSLVCNPPGSWSRMAMVTFCPGLVQHRSMKLVCFCYPYILCIGNTIINNIQDITEHCTAAISMAECSSRVIIFLGKVEGGYKGTRVQGPFWGLSFRLPS